MSLTQMLVSLEKVVKIKRYFICYHIILKMKSYFISCDNIQLSYLLINTC